MEEEANTLEIGAEDKGTGDIHFHFERFGDRQLNVVVRKGAVLSPHRVPLQ